jgi:pyrroline-5-carboxylate reductase
VVNLYRIGLIGAGNMGRAMVGAWIGSGTVDPVDIVVIDKDLEKALLLEEEFGVRTGADVGQVTADSRIIVLAVKPQDSAEALSAIAGKISSSKLLLSIAAGLTISSMRDQVGVEPTIVRVMPNMAALVRAAASGYSVSPGPEGFEGGEVRELLEAIGEAEEVDEGLMNLVTALSGSGPAYFFYLTEAMEEAAVSLGMSREVASKLARQTLWGAAKTVVETGREPGELRKAVSSPGGTTLAALSEMDSSGFVEIMRKAIEAAADRARELAT